MLHTLLYFLALFSLSTAPNWAKLNQMPVEVLGFWRLSLASLLVATWILISKKVKFKDLQTLLVSKKLLWVLLSGFFFFLHLATYKYAAKNTSVANSMIIFSSNPLWSSIGAILFFKEKLTVRLVLAYILAIIGIYSLVFGQIQFNQQTYLGDISSIFSAFFYSCYMLTGKKARQHFDNSIYAFFQYGVCALFFLGTVLITGKSFFGYSTISWISVAGLIILPTFLGHMSLTYLVNHMNLTILSCGKLIEPVLASIIAFFVFHEVLTEQSWIAFSLTVTSVLILFGPDLLQAIRQKNKKIIF